MGNGRADRISLGAVLGAAVLVACSDGGLTTADGDLSVAGDRLEFPRTFVGFPTSAALGVDNTGRGAVPVRFVVAAPFSVADDAPTLSPGTTEVPVRFDPPAPGHYETTLTIDVRGITKSVLLVADAEAVPDCTPTQACRTMTFDPAAGRCVEAIAEDGTSCTAACLEASFCRSGECIGAPRSCDDGNACTTDACDPDTGCVHADATASCPAPTDPCRAAFCDPATGCGVAVVSDGTACGEADCGTMNVCLAGTCKVVPTPEGTACGEASPCQEQGRCRAGTCDQPPPGLMQPAWRYAPTDRVVTLTGSVDGAGSLYAYTGTTASNDVRLVSFTVGGIERWSQGLDRAGFPELQGLGRLFATRDALVLNAQAVEVRRTLDGVRQWSADPDADGAILDASPGGTGRFLGVVRKIDDAALGFSHTELAEIDSTTSATLRSYVDIRNPELGVTDIGGRHLLRHHDPVAGFRVTGLDPGTGVVWTRDSTFWPAATVLDLVFGFDDAGAVALHTTNGNEAYRLPLAPPDWKQERRFVAEDDIAYALSHACDGEDCTWGFGRGWKLVAFTPRDGALRSDTNLIGSAYGPLQLTSRGTALLLEAGDRLRLSEYDDTGTRRFECLADAPFRESDTVAFLDGLLVVGGPRSPEIRAYALPGITPAKRGWVTERGSLARDSRPLP